MLTSRDIVEAKRHLFRIVPHESLPEVCYLCLGPTPNRWKYCANCARLFLKSGCSRSLDGRVVPMTIAENPSAWFWALQTYKRTEFREHASTIGSLANRWLYAHRQRLIDLLDHNNPDFMTVVPSKKGTSTYATQPLRRAVEIVSPPALEMRETLRCVAPMAERLTTYDPGIFETVADVEGAHIILVEDTWITGATALSAAGNLLEAGAEAVVITPIARDMKRAYHAERSPEYIEYLEPEYDLDWWPR